MKGVRVWILVLALTTFVCGVASGTILSERGRLGDQPDFVLGEYERRFAQQFELSPERARALHVFLEEYAREVDRIRAKHLATYRAAMEPDLRDLGIRFDTNIRDKVLPAVQRPRFDQLSNGVPLNF